MHLRRIITSLVILPIFAACVLWEQGEWLTFLAAFTFFVAAQSEFYSLYEVTLSWALRFWQSGLACLFLIFTVFGEIQGLVIISFLFFWGSCLMTISQSVIRSRYEIAVYGLLLIYLLFPLSCFVYLRSIENGPSYLFFMLAVACSTDIGGFYGGKLFGKHKLAPILSPKKTWEGAVAGVILSIVVILFTAFIHNIFYQYTLWIDSPHQYFQMLFVTVVMSSIGQIGDLCESAMKRDAGIKDSGITLTGHGGYLDMGDSMLWIGPAMFVYVVLS